MGVSGLARVEMLSCLSSARHRTSLMRESSAGGCLAESFGKVVAMFLRYIPSSLIRAALFVCTTLLVVLPTALAYPRIGYDYGYFLPRLADTFLYFKSNGPSIQWWTPTFGGGLPVFPNPQDMQLSLPQLFTFVSNPFVAVCATFGLVTLASCYALHRLARGPLAWGEAPACFLAVAVSTGGFLTLRMTAGQASYHAFSLTPLLLLLAMDREIPRRLAIPVVGLLGAYFVQSGGYFVSFAAGLSLAIAVPIVILLAPKARGLLSALAVLAGGAALGLSLSVAKLFAVYSWMRQFPRTPGADSSNSRHFRPAEVYSTGVTQGSEGRRAGCGGANSMMRGGK